MDPQQALDQLEKAHGSGDWTHFIIVKYPDGTYQPLCFKALDDTDAMAIHNRSKLWHGGSLYRRNPFDKIQ